MRCISGVGTAQGPSRGFILRRWGNGISNLEFQISKVLWDWRRTNRRTTEGRTKTMSMLLQCKESSKPHPEGIHPAVCVDVIDLGLVEVEFQGQRKIVNKVKVMFETEQKGEDGKNCNVSRNFTASLHPKAKLS